MHIRLRGGGRERGGIHTVSAGQTLAYGRRPWDRKRERGREGEKGLKNEEGETGWRENERRIERIKRG